MYDEVKYDTIKMYFLNMYIIILKSLGVVQIAVYQLVPVGLVVRRLYGEQEVGGSSPSLADFLAYFSARFPFVFMINIFCLVCDTV